MIAIVEGGAPDLDPVMRVMDAAFDPAFGEAWNRGQCLAMLSLPDVWLHLADGDAGFALARRVLDEAELLLLAVQPDHRRRGVARALIDRTVTEAVSRGATRLLIEVRDGNPALTLYTGVGFGEIGRRRDYYRGAGGALHDAVTLVRPLAARSG